MIRLLLVLIVATAIPAAAAGRPVTFASLDGTQLSGEFFEAAGRPSSFARGASEDKSPGVVLVHMLSRNKSDWRGLPDRIRDAGITALTIDLRGHGGSSGSASDLGAMVQDVRAAAQWLASRANVRPDAIAVVGASLGASLALLAASETPLVRAVAVVSPSLDYRGLRTDTAVIKRIGSRPIWLAASTEDPYALRSVKELTDEGATGEQRLSGVRGHGTALLWADPDLAGALVDWLRRTLIF